MQSAIRQPTPPKPPQPKAILKGLFNKYKKTGVYLLVALFVFLLMAFIAGHAPYAIYVFILLQITLLGLGVLHAWLMYRYFDWPAGGAFWKEAALTLALGILAAIALGLIPRSGLFLAPPSSYAAASVGVIIPFFLLKAFDSWRNIPPRTYKLWYYPYDSEIPILESFEREARILIRRRATDEVYHPIDIAYPADMTLGEVMHYLMFQYNRQSDRDGHSPERVIELAEGNLVDRMYGWQFYLKPGGIFPRRYLDFDQVIADLNIKHRATIVVERVLHPYAPIANHVEEEL